jgi:gliding motility-associated-like protein
MKKFLLLLFITSLLSINNSAEGDSIDSNYSFYNIHTESTFTIDGSIMAPQAEPTFINLVKEATICEGCQYTFDATVNDSKATYSWDDGTIGPKLTVSQADTYKVTVTIEGVQYEEFVVLKTTEVIINMPSSRPYCSSKSATITPSITYIGLTKSDVEFQWYFEGAIISGATSDSYTTTETYGGEYKLVVTPSGVSYTTDGNNSCNTTCTFENTVTYTFPDPPVAEIIGATTICKSEGINLEVVGDYKDVKWYWDDFEVGTGNTLSISASKAKSGKYKVEVTSSGGCKDTDIVDIVIVNDPVFSLSKPVELCNNGGSPTADISMNLTRESGNTYEIKWYKPDGSLHSSDTENITVTKKGIYKASVSVNGMCPVEHSVEIYDVVTLDIGDPAPICSSGGSIILDAWIDGRYNPTYKWTKVGDASFSKTSPSITISNTDGADTYRVTVTTLGCSYTDEATVQIIPEPYFEFENDKQLCGGKTTIDIINFVKDSNTTYEYFLNGDKKANAPPYTVTTSAPNGKVFKLEIFADDGCSYSDEIKIYDEQEATLVASTDEICEKIIGENSSIKLTASVSPDNAPGKKYYVWRDENNNVVRKKTRTGSDSYYISKYKQSGTYTVTITQNGCEKTATKTIKINPKAEINTSNVELCGGSVNIPISITNAKNNHDNKVWYKYEISGPESKSNVSQSTSQNFSVSTPGIYTITVSAKATPDNYGCPTTTTIEVFDEPTATINIDNTEWCESESHTINSTNTGTEGISSYKWYRNNNPINKNNINKYTPTQNGDYKLIITYNNGCTAESNTITITINPTPTFSMDDAVICNGNDVTIGPNEDLLGYTFSWSNGNNNKTITTNSPGTYCLRIYSPDGCPSVEQCITVSEEFLDITVDQCFPGNITANITEYDGSNTVNQNSGHTYHWTTGGYWNEGGTNVGGNSNSLSPPPAGDGQYYLVVETKNGCLLKQTADITVIPEIIDFEINAPLDRCFDFDGGNNTMTLTTNGTNLPANTIYQWARNGKILASEIGSTLVINEEGHYEVWVSINNGANTVYCGDSNHASITISQIDYNFCLLEDINGSCLDAYEVCEGPVTIGYDLGSNATYTWSTSNGGSIAPPNHIDNSHITVTQSGRYRLQATDGGCNYDKFIDITIAQKPSITVNESNKICQGDVTLTASVTNGDINNVEWYKNGAYQSTGAIYTATSGGIYKAYISTAIGCDDEVIIDIPTDAVPNIQPISDIYECEGVGTISIPVSITNMLAATNGFYYELYQNNNLVDPIDYSPTTNIGRNYTFVLAENDIVNGGYTVKVYFDGCLSSKSFNINITSSPVPDINGGVLMCGNTTRLWADKMGKYPGATFEWTDGNGFIKGKNNYLDVDTEGEYHVEITHNSCIGEGFVTVYKQDINNIQQDEVDICKGNNATFTSSITDINNATYTWEYNGVTISGANSITHTDNRGGKYTLTTTDENSCEYIEIFNLNVIDVVQPDIKDVYNHCDKGSSLFITVGNSNIDINYSWWVKDKGTWFNLKQTGPEFEFNTSFKKIDYNKTFKVIAKQGTCSNEKEFTVKQGENLIFDIEKYKVTCQGYRLDLVPKNPTRFSTANKYWYKDGVHIPEYDNYTSIDVFGEGGTYRVDVESNSQDCGSSRTIEVEDLYPTDFIIDEEVYLCNGSSTFIDVSLPAASNVKYYYYFDQEITLAEAKNFELLNQGWHTFRIETEDGCELADSVYAIPTTFKISTRNTFVDCIGIQKDIIATGTGADSYVWFQNDVEIEGEHTNKLTVTIREQIDTYRVEAYSTLSGCSSESTTIVRPTVMPNIELDDYIICDGQTQILDAEPKTSGIDVTGYYWFKINDDGTETALNHHDNPDDYINDSTYEATENGTYHVTITTTQCTYNVPVQLDVNPTPRFKFDEDILGCVDKLPVLDLIHLDADTDWDNVTYTWFVDKTNDGIDNFEEIVGYTNPTYTVVEMGSYMAIVTSDKGCSFEDTIKVDYDINPIFSLVGNISECTTTRPLLEIADLNVDLDLNNVILSYNWQYKTLDTDTFTDLNNNTENHEVTKDGWYKLSISTDAGCVSSDSVYVDYKPQPIVDLIIPELDCQQERPILSADVINIDDLISQGEDINYTWYYEGKIVEGATESNLEIVKDGEYKVEVSTPTCIGKDSATIDYIAKPIVNLSTDDLQCLVGNPIIKSTIGNLTDLETQGDNISYEWWYKTNLTDTDSTLVSGENNSELTTNIDGTYTVVVSTDNCSSATSIEIDFSSEPTFDLGSDIAGCTITRPKLEVIISNSNIDQTSEIKTYQWWYKAEGSNTYNKEDSTKSHYFVTKDGIFKAVVETIDGCMFEDSVKVDYNPQPVVDFNLNYDEDLCQEAPGYINITLKNEKDFEEGLEYYWTRPILADTITLEPRLKIHSEGEYSVNVKTVNGCESGIQNTTIYYKPKPEITAIPKWNQNSCRKTDSYIEVSLDNDSENFVGKITYFWERPILNDTTTVEPRLLVRSGGPYTVQAIVEGGCSSDIFEIDVDFHPTPTISLKVEGDTATCTFDDVLLKVKINNSEYDFGSVKYLWSRPEANDTTTTKPELLVHKKGIYSVKAITDFDCESIPASKKIDYRPRPRIEAEPNWNGLDCIAENDDAGYITVNIVNKSDCKEEDIRYTWTLPDLSTQETDEPKLKVHSIGEYWVKAITDEGCFSEPKSIIINNYKPEPFFTLNGGETCEIDSKIIEANLNEMNTDIDKDELTYEWSNGVVGKGEEYRAIEVKLDEDISTTKTVKYSVRVTTESGCDLTQDAFVSFSPSPIFDLGDDIEMCDIETRQLTIGDIPHDKITWNTGETSKSITVDKAGEYSATVELDGCTYTDVVNVETVPFPKFSIEAIKMDCDTKVISLVLKTEEQNIDILWSTNETDKNIQITKGGDYSVVVSRKGKDSSVGCSIAKNIEIKDQFFEDLNSEEDMNICEGETVELKPEYEYESIKWSNGSTSPSIFVKEEGTYSATITNKYFCSYELLYNVIVDEGPEITKLDVTEGTLSFDHQGGIAPFEYFIDDVEVVSKNVVNDFTQGTHTLYIKDKYGCDCSQDFDVEDPISISDILTPNGDGFNDTWKIEDLQRYPRSKVTIYDRYGRVMHKSAGNTLNWDGRFDGHNVPATDYWYHIDMFGDGRLVYTGHFALIR